MKYVPLPITRIETGKPLPVHVWDTKGNLLLRKGQTIDSEQHREVLVAHQACLTESDEQAWVCSYDRLVYDLIRENVSTQQIAQSTMPGTILDVDYVVGHDVSDGWLDLQAVLSGILVQGAATQTAGWAWSTSCDRSCLWPTLRHAPVEWACQHWGSIHLEPMCVWPTERSPYPSAAVQRPICHLS